LSKTYKIGTRGSLLAKTQCEQLKNKLIEDTQQKYQLEFIKTQGDIQTDKPLWQLEGKDFFTKELDTALLNEDVDLVVHSYKDLGSERPAGIKLGAITQRKFAQDILLIRKSVLQEIHSLDEVIIGTSSPRRIYNIENFLGEYIPTKKEVVVTTKMLRGNINTRIQKLKDGEYHGIVLALAGIERLALSEDSAIILKDLLDDLTFMILPQSVFPSAASQGALGIEYFESAKNANSIREFISTQNHQDSIDEIERERKAFLEYGGGCHLAVGINVTKVKDHYLHIHRGETDGKKIEFKWLERAYKVPTYSGRVYIGLPEEKIAKYNTENYLADGLMNKVKTSSKASQGNLYVTSSYCLDNITDFDSLWSSGAETMKAMAKKGYWVNGSSDSLGDEALLSLISSRALSFMLSSDQWHTLSHAGATTKIGSLVPCYEREVELLVPDHYPSQMEQCSAFYWSSFFQYRTHLQLYPNIADKVHCCGLGKTYDLFLENNIAVYPFATVQDFLQERA